MCRHRGELNQWKYKGDQLRLVGNQHAESISSFIYHGGIKEGMFFLFDMGTPGLNTGLKDRSVELSIT